MNRTIALAYGITGLAVAAALVAVIGTTTGLIGGGASPVENVPAAAVPLTSPATPPAPPGAALPGVPADAEVVYVDAPPAARRGGDHDDDDDDERGEHGARGKRHHEEREDDDD